MNPPNTLLTESDVVPDYRVGRDRALLLSVREINSVDETKLSILTTSTFSDRTRTGNLT